MPHRHLAAPSHWLPCCCRCSGSALMIFFGKRLPRQGDWLETAIITTALLCALVVLCQKLTALPARDSDAELHLGGFPQRPGHRTAEDRPGLLHRQPDGDHAGGRHAHQHAGAFLLHRLHARRRPLLALLRLPRALLLLDADDRPGQQPLPAVRRMGAGRHLLVPADRPLVREEERFERRR